MAVNAGAIITVAELKAYVGVTTTDFDTIFEIFINSVSDEFNAYVGRKLGKATYTDVYFDGPAGSDLLLPHFPVVSITSIEEDGDTLVEGDYDDYLLYADAGIIRRVMGSWLRGNKTIKITYVAGYVVQGATLGTGETALPGDLRLACLAQCAREWKKAQGAEWGMTSRSFPDGSVTRTEKGLLQEVTDVLDRHRNFRL